MTDDLTEHSSPRRVTMRNIADETGLALSTVSRALSKPGRVSSATAVRVRQAAARVGYRMPAHDWPTTSTSTRTLALMMSDMTNPFFFEVLRGAQEAASRAG